MAGSVLHRVALDGHPPITLAGLERSTTKMTRRLAAWNAGSGGFTTMASKGRIGFPSEDQAVDEAVRVKGVALVFAGRRGP